MPKPKNPVAKAKAQVGAKDVPADVRLEEGSSDPSHRAAWKQAKQAGHVDLVTEKDIILGYDGSISTCKYLSDFRYGRTGSKFRVH